MSKGVWYMLLATLSFSLMNVGVKALRHIPFHEIILFRSFVSLVMSYAYLRRYKLPILGNNRKLLLFRGIAGTAALSLLFLAIHHLPLATASTLQYLSPIFTAFLGISLLSEPVRKVQWLFFGVAFAGVVLIRGFDPDVSLLFIGVGLASAFFSGIAYTLVRMLRTTDHPLTVVFYFPLVAIPFMTIGCLFHWEQPKGWDWGLLLAIGVLTQIGQVYMSKALQLENAARMTSISFLGTIIALFFSVYLFHETYNWISLLGIGLIVTGVLLNIHVTSPARLARQSEANRNR